MPEDFSGGIEEHDVRIFVFADVEPGAPEFFILGEDDEGVLLGRGEAFAHGALDHAANEAGSLLKHGSFVDERAGEGRIGLESFCPRAAAVTGLLAEAKDQDGGVASDGFRQDEALAGEGFAGCNGHSGLGCGVKGQEEGGHQKDRQTSPRVAARRGFLWLGFHFETI